MRAINIIIDVGWILFWVYWLVMAAAQAERSRWTRSAGAWAGIILVILLFSAVIEERAMAKLFPADYPPYKRATKMLIPYLL